MNTQNPKEVKKQKENKEKQLTPKQLAEFKADVKRAELLADLLDDKMIDPIAGLFPGAGDTATALAGLYIIYQAKKMDMPYHKLAVMAGRQALDFGGGTIPIIGDLFDFVYKSNKANAEMLRKHFEKIEKEQSQNQLGKLKKDL
jgi:hypothetical protein